MIRVAIADDQELAREGFSRILDAQTEIEVVGTAGTGAEAVDIARCGLFLSEATVKTHIARTLAKLALRDRVHAVVFAYEHGLIRPGQG